MPTALVRKVDELFARYAESHRHPTNTAIHWVCVPLITWSILAFFWAISPSVALVAMALALAWYVWLSPSLALGMAIVLAAMSGPLMLVDYHLMRVAMIVFVLAWIGQFIGHQIEGRKPSFLEDLTFLLVGPAWLAGAVYRRLGLRY